MLFDQTRLKIISLLYVKNNITFSNLKEELKDVSDGTMNFHLKKLNESGYIEIDRVYITKPTTTYYITEFGRKSLKNHIKYLKKIIKSL